MGALSLTAILLIVCLGALLLAGLIYVGVRLIRTEQEQRMPLPRQQPPVDDPNLGAGTYQPPEDRSISGYDLEQEPGRTPGAGYNMPPEQLRRGKFREGDEDTTP